MMGDFSQIPDVYVYDADNAAEPYWETMGDLSELNGDDIYTEEGKQVVVGVCAMAKKSQSKPMKEILTRLEEFEYIKMIVFPEDVILQKPVEEWPICDCLISFHSKGFPLDKAIYYAKLRNPFIINNLPMQYDIQDRRKVYSILESEGIEIPRYAVLDRDSPNPKDHELVESEDHVEVNGVIFNKPFVEKPVSAEDHNIYIYYPTSAGGGSQRLFRKIGSRSSVYSPESRVRKTGSFIYEDFMPTDGTDVKVYTVGPDYAHAEARKSPALDGKVERDSEGKEIRYPVILSNAEKLISRKVCLAFKQTVCGFDLLRANGKSFVCDVNGFSFVKNSNKYYDDCAKILGNMILRELAPTLHIPWSVPFQLDDPPIVPTTFGKMMELRCVVAVIRHGDRTPKQKMKVEVRHSKFFDIFEKYGGHVNGHVKLKRPKQLQEILDIARSLLNEIEHRAADPEIEEKQGKLEQLKSVLEMYGHFSGINRKVQMKYQPKGRPRGSSSDDDAPKEPSLVLILKWGGELTPAGRIQAEELGRIFRCMYPGGQGEYAGTQGLGLLRLHSTFRHDLKIYASDEGRVQMTAAAFAKGLLALEGELTPILVQMVKSANTNGLLDNDCDASKHQNMAKTRLHELMQQDQDFTPEDREIINPCHSISISMALDFVKNPVKCCERVQDLIQKLMNIVRTKKDDPKTKDAILYHGETWELMMRRWGKIEKDFCTKNKTFDISKIPDIYDCIKYDLQHNQHTLQFDQAEELYINAKYLADIVIPQEYGLTKAEKLTISQGICTPLLKKIRADLQRNIEECGDETVNRLNPRYSHGVSSPGRHVRTRLYFTSESHIHSLLTVLRHGGLVDSAKDEQWRRAMEYVSMVSELNYMSQVVIMLYEDPTKDPSSEERFHVELHFSPGVNCCVQKNLPPGPGFRPHSRNDQSKHLSRIDQEDTTTEENSSSHTSTVSDSSGMSDCSPPSERKLTESVSSEFKMKSSEPIPIRASASSNCASDLGSRLVTEEKHSLSVGSKQIRPPPSPENEPRSRSFDQSRNANSNECCTEDGHTNNNANSPSNIKADQCHTICGSQKFSVSLDKSYKNQVFEFSSVKKKHLGNAWHSIRSNSFDLGDHVDHRIQFSETSFPIRYNPRKIKNVSADFFDEPSNKIDLRALDLAHVEVYPHHSTERRDNPPAFSSRQNCTKLSPFANILDTCKSDTSSNCSEDILQPNIHIQVGNIHESNSAFVVLPQNNNSVKLNVDTKIVSQCSNSLCATNESENTKDIVSSKKEVLSQEKNIFENLFSGSVLVTNTESITFNRRSVSEYITTIEEHSDGESPYSKSPTLEANGAELSKENIFYPNDADDLSKSIEADISQSERNISPTSDLTSKDSVATIKPPKIIFVKNKYATQRSAPSGFNTDPVIKSHTVVSSHSSEFPNCFYQIVDDPDALYFPVSPIAESRTKYPIENSHDDTVESPTPAEIHYEMQMQHLIRPSARRTHSVSHCLDMTRLSPPSLDPSQSRRHRHGISGQMSYFRMSGYGLIVQHQKRGGSTSSLFSTAVISGSSSAPNLRDMIPNTASVAAAIDGCGGVPPIRPLETLHNALSLKQLDQFLNRMTHGLSNRTPASSPPKSSAALSQPVQSPNNSTGWSGPPSFVSSSGPSSPNGLSDIFHGTSATSDSSDMSASIISSDGLSILGSRTVSSNMYGHRDSIEIPEFYNAPHLLHSMVHFSPIQASASGDSGELTPISLGSEIDEPFHEYREEMGVTDNVMSDDIEPEILVCEDEEKTLTASTREDMIRPRLAEIKWTRDDEEDITHKYIHSRVECADGSESQPSHSKGCTSVPSADSYLKKYFVSCLHEVPLKQQAVANCGGTDRKVEEYSGNICNYNNKSSVKKSKYVNESDVSTMYSDSNTLRTDMHTASCEGVFEMDSEMSETVQSETGAVPSMDSKLSSGIDSYRNLSCSVSPTLTLAASLTDKNSVSRGFVIPQENTDP